MVYGMQDFYNNSKNLAQMDSRARSTSLKIGPAVFGVHCSKCKGGKTL